MSIISMASLQTYNFIHEFPGFLHGPPISCGLFRWSHCILDSVDDAQDTTLASIWSTSTGASPVESCCHVLCAERREAEKGQISLILKTLLHFWEKPLHLQTISVDCPCEGSIIHFCLVDFGFIIVKLCCFLPSGLHKSPCHVPTLIIHGLTAKSKCNRITLEQ